MTDTKITPGPQKNAVNDPKLDPTKQPQQQAEHKEADKNRQPGENKPQQK